MGFEPILSVPQTDVLTINTINTICSSIRIRTLTFSSVVKGAIRYTIELFAPPERFELSSAVLETDMLPLHQRDVYYEGNDGFEPSADRLTVYCSTAELIPLKTKNPLTLWLEGLYNSNVIYILSYIRIL